MKSAQHKQQIRLEVKTGFEKTKKQEKHKEIPRESRNLFLEKVMKREISSHLK